jgi:hypothetical protein
MLCVRVCVCVVKAGAKKERQGNPSCPSVLRLVKRHKFTYECLGDCLVNTYLCDSKS